MTGRHPSKDPVHHPRRDKQLGAHLQDPYHVREKWPEPTTCPNCGLIYQQGRWQWGEAKAASHLQRCPACARIHDHVPAGELCLAGDFLHAHRQELLQLIKNHEQAEKAEHPLERIMAIDEQASGITITFTGSHLARSTGEALRHAYQGELDIHPDEGGGITRVYWRR